MLISKEVEIKLVGRTIKRYKELGYEIPLHKTKDGMRVKNGTVIKIKIEDLSKDSHEYVEYSCDYCGKKDLKMRYDRYNVAREVIQKDSCNECKIKKITDVNMKKYGVENSFQREDVKKKSIETCLDKFGVTHPMKNADIKIKAMTNMSFNNGVETSKQQKFLQQLLGGNLNYMDDSTKGYCLDIAFPEKKIYIEYDGSGHDLQVKFGNYTQDEFDKREIVRYQILKRSGWKCIKIISLQDYLPVLNDIIIKEINNAKEWLYIEGNGHSHYNIEFGTPRKNNKDYKLRKIKDEDLKQVV